MRQAIEAGQIAGKALAGDPHPIYRPDIDGLRAIAVLAVVGYHAFPSSVPGGLVGVDIFFVISGYLISAIIVKGLRQGRFSYIDFYVRRIKRIFPALLLVLSACLVFGWFTLFGKEYQSLGKHVAGGAGFISNFLFWQEAGYFDTSAQFKELLHLWSLGIEEQFYLLWPLLLTLFIKRVHALLPLIVSLLVISFTLNAALIHSQPIATFYLPATRFWELMIGALLAYAALSKDQLHRLIPTGLRAGWLADGRSRRVLSEICGVIGLLLLVAAFLLVSERQPYPGVLALLPTLGAACLIAAGPAVGVNRYLLAAPPLVFIGLISYPMYLWHWPLLSFTRILSSDIPGRPTRVAIVVLTAILAWLTYRFIEKPIRSNRSHMPAVVLAILAVAIGGAGLFIYQDNGLESRAINVASAATEALLTQSLALDKSLRKGQYKMQDCSDLEITPVARKFCGSYGRLGDEPIVLWGDSHAEAWSPVFFEIAREKKLRVYLLTVGGCPPLIETRRADADGKWTSCFTFGNAENFVDAIAKIKPTHIFLIGYWSLYTPPHAIETADAAPPDETGKRLLQSQLIKTLQVLPQDVPVTIFRTGPILRGDLERGLLRKARIEPTAEEYALREADANGAISGAASARQNISVFDPGPLVCSDTCKAVLDGTLMYFDSGHMSAQGSLLYRDILLRDFWPSGMSDNL